MILIDVTYLYRLGKAMSRIREISLNETYSSALIKSGNSRMELEAFLNNIDYKNITKLAVKPAKELIADLRVIEDGIVHEGKIEEKIPFKIARRLPGLFQKFESLLEAEFRNGNLFMVTPKGAYDARSLIEEGESLFPPEFSKLFPDAVDDVRKGARCLAFELYTASGFHFHRANETVVLEYVKHLGAKPESKNMGGYIKALVKAGAPEKITACLRDLKDLHRNPLIHPEHSIDLPHDAIALMNAIQSAIMAMMKEMPPPPSD